MKKKKDNRIRNGWITAIIGCIFVDIIMYIIGDKDIFGFLMFDFLFGMFFFCIGAGINLSPDNTDYENANSLASYYETDRATGEIIAELRKLNRDLGNGNGSSCDANSLSSYYETNRANGAIIAELQRLNYNAGSSAGANSQSSYYGTNRANGAIIDNLKQVRTSTYRSKDDIANQIKSSLNNRRDY